MNALDRRVSIRRILVAVDASTQSLSALRRAAQLAEDLQVELAGVFVEDIDVLKSVALPVVKEVNRWSGKIGSVDEVGILQQFKSQASRAKLALEQVAIQHHIKWSFKVVRGGVAQEVVAAADEMDLVTLGKTGWSPGQRLGSTAQTVVAKAHCMTLLHRSSEIQKQGISIVFDGSKQGEKALRLGCWIGAGHSVMVFVVADTKPEFEALKKHAESIVNDSNRVVIQWILDAKEIGSKKEFDMIILPVEWGREICHDLDCSILLVH